MEIFSVYGRIRSIDLPLDVKLFLPRGHAHVEFDRVEDAQDAMLHMNGASIDGQEVTAKEVLGLEAASGAGNNRKRAPGSASRPRAPPANRRRSSPPRMNNRRMSPMRRSRSPRRRSRSPRFNRRNRRGSVSSGTASPSPRRKNSPPANRRRRYSRSSSESD